MHPKACSCLGLPNLTGRHLGCFRDKCWPVDLKRHKVSTKKPRSTMMAIPGLKRERIPDSRMICLSLMEPAYSGEINVTAP